MHAEIHPASSKYADKDNLVDYRLVVLFSSISFFLSILIGLIGVAAMIGWVFDITLLKSLTPNMITMKPNAVLAFILISTALVLQHVKAKTNQPVISIIVKFLAIFVALIGMLTLLENITGYNFHIDEILFPESPYAIMSYAPGRMAPITSLVFMLTGGAVIIADNKRGVFISQIFSLFIGLFGLMVIANYTYHINVTAEIAPYIYAALPAAINFVFLFIAILFLYPAQGFCRLLVSKTESGYRARYLLPVAIFLPPILGYIRLLAEEWGLYDEKSGIAFLIFFTSAIFTTLIFIISFKFMKLDVLRIQEEKELKQALINLERSNSELEQFAYIASHDLQEPLRMVSSYTQLLARRYQDKLDKDANDFIGYAVDGANRMQRLINDLLGYSRVTTKAQPFEAVDSTELLKKAIMNLQASIQESHAEITYDPLPVIYAESTQIMQVFQNLIGNSIKFCDKKPQIHVSAKSVGNAWEFSVKDNGIGIAPEYHEQLFVLFRRLNAREKYSGTGMGLAICKKIIKRHGGKIWLKSEAGKGATFYFTIPKKEI